MKCKELGFRGLEGKFAAFPVTDRIKSSIAGFPGADGADCILTYGYIDHEAGFTFEIIAAGEKKGAMYRFSDNSPEKSIKIRIDALMDEEVTVFSDSSLSKRYADKLSALDQYKASDEILQSRTLTAIDDSRNEVFPDDVTVYLMKDGFKPEDCWVRICGLRNRRLIGTLLNEPYQDLGCHAGDTISVQVGETTDKKIVCFSDLLPGKTLTPKDLEDGSLLKQAVALFDGDRTEENFVRVMQFLRDSNVWVPCVALSKDDTAVELREDQALRSEGGVFLIPEILKNDESRFLPVFSSMKEMEKHKGSFTKVLCPFLDILPLAENSELSVEGIVLDPYGEMFILEKKVFDFVKGLSSQL
ncbi:MAG: SseB family protein [Ruminococcus sp.]|nr:SseB family protein [Ruminococcus sp.]